MSSYFYTSQKPDLKNSQSFSCPERKRVVKCAIIPVQTSCLWNCWFKLGFCKWRKTGNTKYRTFIQFSRELNKYTHIQRLSATLFATKNSFLHGHESWGKYVSWAPTADTWAFTGKLTLFNQLIIHFSPFIQRLLRLSYVLHVLSVFTHLFLNCSWRNSYFGPRSHDLWLTGKCFTSRVTAFAILCQADNCSRILWVDGRILWVDCRCEYCIVLISIPFMNAKGKSDIHPQSHFESLSRLLLSEVKSNAVNWKHFWFPLTLKHANGKFTPAMGGTDHRFFSYAFWTVLCLYCNISSVKKLESHFSP